MTTRSNTASRRVWLVLVVLACGWPAGACSDREKRAVADGSAQQTDRSAQEAVERVPEARQVGAAFVEVARRLAPSVVRVTTQQRARSSAHSRGPAHDLFEGTPFEDLFEQFGGVPRRPQAPRIGTGSGLVIDDRGHVLTNHHVVANADEVQVTFVDGKELPAKLVAADPDTDLAVLRVEGADAAPAEFGDSEALQVGQWLIAIGNPFGLDHSVTVGVLSAKGRYGFAPGKVEDFLQTDASINPGNSGGPLVSLDGKVVGINTMIAGLGTGVGFAVSEALARPISQQLIEHGKVTRPYIGIVMQTVTPDLTAALGAGAPESGAIVAEVRPGSPAERAGIQPGDVVVSVAGKRTTDSRAVQHAVLDQAIGEAVSITVWRDGAEQDVSLSPAALPDESAARGPSAGEGELGLGLQTLSPEVAQGLGLDAATRGAVVTRVRPGSTAQRAGLEAGDVIVRVDESPVSTAQQAAKLLGQERPGGHLARIRRGERSLFVAIQNP